MIESGSLLPLQSVTVSPGRTIAATTTHVDVSHASIYGTVPTVKQDLLCCLLFVFDFD